MKLTEGNNQVDALKSLNFSERQLPPIKDFISKERLNVEIMSELERIEKEEKKLTEIKWLTKGIINSMILENLKRYAFFVVILEPILIIWISKTMSKTV